MAATKLQLMETDGKEVIDVTMDNSSAIQSTSKRHSRSPSPSASPRKRTRRSPPPSHSEATDIGHNHNEATTPELTSPVDVVTRSHPPSPPPLSEPPLTLREISLLRRLQAKETQVNSLLETLTALSQNPASRPPPPPQVGSSSNCLPFNDPPLPDAATATPISVPKALLPVFAQLRARTLQLVEENTLLRSLLEENEAVSEWEGEGKGKGKEATGGTRGRRKGKKKTTGIDLKKVVERMKLLTRENEELGSVLEEFEGWAGVQGERMRFEESVRESHEMIRLLDSDLDLAQTQIALLVDRLEEYQQKFGLLPSSTDANSSPPKSKPDDTPPSQDEDDVKTNARSRSSSVALSSNVPVAAKTEPPPPPNVAALLAILSPESAILRSDWGDVIQD